LSVSEKRASRTLVDALRAKLARPELVERFVSVFRQRTAARLAEGAPADRLPERLRDGERRIANLTEALAKVGGSEALAAKLREEEATLGRLEAERTAAGRRPTAPVVPHPTAIAAT
jgi:hypothetical protein